MKITDKNEMESETTEEKIEYLLEQILEETKSLNIKLSIYYTGKCNVCDTTINLLKSDYEEQIEHNWYFALNIKHGDIQTEDEFNETLDEPCDGTIEIYDDDF